MLQSTPVLGWNKVLGQKTSCCVQKLSRRGTPAIRYMQSLVCAWRKGREEERSAGSLPIYTSPGLRLAAERAMFRAKLGVFAIARSYRARFVRICTSQPILHPQCDGAHSAWDWADPGRASVSVLVAAADSAGGAVADVRGRRVRRETFPMGEAGAHAGAEQEHWVPNGRSRSARWC